MEPMAPGLTVTRADIARFCEKWQIRELALFGSAARGELRPDSDIDFMVTFAADAPWSLWDFAEMREQLKDLVGREVDVIERGPIRNPFKREQIMRDLTVVYAA